MTELLLYPEGKVLDALGTPLQCNECDQHHNICLYSSNLQRLFEDRTIRREFQIKPNKDTYRHQSIDSANIVSRYSLNCKQNNKITKYEPNIDLWWKFKIHYPNYTPTLMNISHLTICKMIWTIVFILQMYLSIHQFIILPYEIHWKYILFTFITLLIVGCIVFAIGKYVENNFMDSTRLWNKYPQILDSRYFEIIKQCTYYCSDMEQFLLCYNVQSYIKHKCNSVTLAFITMIVCMITLFVLIIYVPILVSYELCKSMPVNGMLWVIPDMYDWQLDFDYFIINKLLKNIKNTENKTKMKLVSYHMFNTIVVFVIKQFSTSNIENRVNAFEHTNRKRKFKEDNLDIIFKNYIDCLNNYTVDKKYLLNDINKLVCDKHTFNSIEICKTNFECTLSLQLFGNDSLLKCWKYLLWNESLVFYIWLICIVWRCIYIVNFNFMENNLYLFCFEIVLDCIFFILWFIYTYIQISYVESYFNKKTKNIQFWFDERILLYVNECICKGDCRIGATESEMFVICLKIYEMCMDEFLNNFVCNQFLCIQNYLHKTYGVPNEIAFIIVEFACDDYCIEHIFDELNTNLESMKDEYGNYDAGKLTQWAQNYITQVSSTVNQLA